MNEKHYDNLCEIARRIGKDGADTNLSLAMLAICGRYFDKTANKVRLIADLYNALDILCIALGCEDEVRNMAKSIADEQLASAWNPLKS